MEIAPSAARWHLQFAQRWVVQYNFYVNVGLALTQRVPICTTFPVVASRTATCSMIARRGVTFVSSSS
jgi:hypothetical protein